MGLELGKNPYTPEPTYTDRRASPEGKLPPKTPVVHASCREVPTRRRNRILLNLGVAVGSGAISMAVWVLWGYMPLLGLLSPLVALALFVFLTIRVTRWVEKRYADLANIECPNCHTAILFDLTDQHGVLKQRHDTFCSSCGKDYIVEVTDMPAIPWL